jgi:hypothetical protein
MRVNRTIAIGDSLGQGLTYLDWLTRHREAPHPPRKRTATKGPARTRAGPFPKRRPRE